MADCCCVLQAAEKFKAPEASAAASKEAEQEVSVVEEGEESDGEEVRGAGCVGVVTPPIMDSKSNCGVPPYSLTSLVPNAFPEERPAVHSAYARNFNGK